MELEAVPDGQDFSSVLDQVKKEASDREEAIAGTMKEYQGSLWR